MAPDEDRPPRSLAEHFQSHDPSRQGGAWDALWGEGFTPWDRGGPSWALYDLLTERPDLFEPLSNEDTSAGAVCGTSTGKERGKKTALVPGCGRGHDVLLLSSLGYDMVGLEVSEHALEEARKNATAAAAAAAAAVRAGAGEGENGVSRGRIRWISGDFFQDDWLREAADIVGSGGVGGGGGGGGGKFDLIFDYTFLCALHPTMRPRWAERTRDLLAPGGRLVCLEFPSRDPAGQGPGPPWALPPHAYAAYLSRPGSPVPALDSNGAVVPGDYAPPPRDDGLERLAHLKPRRTHPAGAKGGDVQDRISVWRHRASKGIGLVIGE